MSDEAARAFLKDAHRNGQRGDVMLRRWARARNQDRQYPGKRIEIPVIERAIELEKEGEK